MFECFGKHSPPICFEGPSTFRAPTFKEGGGVGGEPLRPLPLGMHRGGENQPCRVPSCMERIFQVRLRSARGLPNAPTPKVAEIECNGNNTVLRKSRFAIKYGARRSRRGAARDAHFNSSPRFEQAKLQKSAAGTRWSSLARCQIAWDAPA